MHFGVALRHGLQRDRRVFAPFHSPDFIRFLPPPHASFWLWVAISRLCTEFPREPKRCRLIFQCFSTDYPSMRKRRFTIS